MGALPFQPDDPVTALRRAMLAHGFQPVAIKTGEKAPLNRGWQTFNGLPAYSPISANTGVNCSPLRAIDIDIDDQQAAQTAVALAVEQLGATPLVRFRSGSPRRLLVYRGSGLKRIVKTQAGKVEILGKGQQFVAFGVHPDGSDFDWEGETPASFSLADLPEATPDAEQAFADALIAALGGVETVESPSPAPSPFRPVVVSDSRLGESVGFREINDLALARLASWVPAIFPGAKHQAGTGAYRVSSRQLGRSLQEDLSLAPTGIVDFGVADMGDARSGKRTPIDTVMQWGGAPDPIQAALWLADKLGVKFQTDRDEVPVTVVEAVAGMVEGKAKAAIPAIPFAEIDFAEGVDWTRPAGVLGEIVEWILATSRRPNRPLAVASATAIVSTVCGRHLYGPTGSALNVYIACLGDSGIGKGRPLAAISEVLKAAGLAGLHASGKVFSVSGIENILRDAPCCVATIDEMGDELLKPILNTKANSHESRIKTALQVLWSRNIGDPPFSAIARAGQSAASSERDIHCPSFTMWGASTPEAFYGALNAGNVTDGLMNRVLIAEAAPMGARNRFERVPVPQIVVDSLQSLVPSLTGDIGEAMGVYAFRGDVEDRCMEWASPEVEAISERLEDDILEAKAKKPPAHDLMARTFEYAVRLASIHAVSRAGSHAKVTLVDLKWGAAWSVHSTRLMMRSAENEMSESDYEKTMNRIKKVVREAGTISRRDILRKVQGIKSHERDMALTHLVEAGIIEALAIEQRGRGRPIGLYRWHG